MTQRQRASAQRFARVRSSAPADRVTGYPEHLAGDPAPPPEDVPPRLLAMAAKAHGKHLDRLPALFGAAGWPTSPRPA